MAFNSTVASTISVFYAAAFDRTPVPDSSLPDFGDLGGLAFWTDAFLEGEGDLAQYNNNVYAIADFFVASPEFLARYPATLTDEQYVTALYNNLLGRGPDADGLAFWVGELEGGASRGTVLADFTNSPEAQNFNPTQQAAMQSFIALLAANEGVVTPEQATEWVAENPTLDAAVIDNPEVPTLTLAEALAALATDELPEQYLIDSTEPLDAGAVAVADAQAVYPQVVEVLTGALNAAALPADLFAWAILDTATNILAAVEDPAVTGAGSVALSEGVNVAQITPMSAVANFDGVYAVADTLTNLTAQPASVIALINAATEIAVTDQISIEELGTVTTLYGAKVTGYNLLDTAANLTDEANADIVAAATSIEVDGAVTVAEHAALVPLLGEDFGYTLADTFDNLLAAPELVAGATAYALTDEPGSLGRLLDEEQVAILEGATNAADYTFATLSFAAAAPTINEGNALAFTVTLSEPVTDPVTVSFQLNAGDPTGPNVGTNLTNLADFETGDFNPATVIIPAGATTATFNVTPQNDGITELPEGFSVTATVASVGWTDEAEANVLDGTGPTGGQIFTLTVNQDVIPGLIGSVGTTSTAGNDTINALATQNGAGVLINTLQNVDSIDAGAGDDVLNVTLAEAKAVATTIRNVETINVRFADGGATLDLANTTGATALSVADSTTVAQVNNVGAIASLAVKNQNQNVGFDKSTATTLALTLDTVGNANANIKVDLGTGAAAKATTLNVTANNAFVNVDSTTADTVGTLTIAATGTNRLNFADSGATIKSATITGAGSVDLIGTVANPGTPLTGALTKFDASASTGNIKADIQSTARADVTTGTGNDWIDMDTAVVVGTTVNLGGGNDTLLTGALLGNFAKVDGGEGTDTINITNGTVALTAANAKLITGFETLDVSGGTGNYDVSLNNFATVQIDEAVNGVLAGAVDFKNAPDSFTLNVASKASTNADFAVGNTITVTGKDYAGTTALGTAETFTLIANMRDGNKDDTADGNINANTITVAGVENLVVESNVSVLDGGTKALGAANHTLTAKFVATEAETITVKGAASVDLSGATTIGVVAKVDATASTGNVKIDFSGHAKSVAYFGSEGIDTYTASTKGDNIYTGKGADIVTLTNGVRDTFVLKTATDSQIGDTNKDGKITLAGDEATAGGVQTIDTITKFETGGTDTTDRLDVTNFAFSGAQRGVVNVSAIVTNATDLTSIADLFAAPAGDRGVAYSTIGADSYVFIDANKDGNFTAADDLIIKMVGVTTLSEVDINF